MTHIDVNHNCESCAGNDEIENKKKFASSLRMMFVTQLCLILILNDSCDFLLFSRSKEANLSRNLDGGH
jgi:hypothetical protein